MQSPGNPSAAARQAPLLAALAAAPRVAELASAPSAGLDMPRLETDGARLLELLTVLRDEPALAFDQLSYLTATDELPAEPRFRVAYFLVSTRLNWRVGVVVNVAEGASVPSCTGIYRGANWMEREVFDMFGVPFDGHPELKRIMMPEGYLYHPLRKDFPLEGIQPDRLYRDWEDARTAALDEGKRGVNGGRGA
jgi:NADH-quinone oxidoreductase subunit C